MHFNQWILEENNHWLAINKPSGLIVERSPFEKPTIEDLTHTYLSTTNKKPYLGIVHRLDRVTSGVLLMAKKKNTLRLLNQQFAERSVKKVYWALVSKQPPKEEGLLKHWLEKDQRNKRAVIHLAAVSSAQEVSLTYNVIDQQSDRFLLEIQPHTGKFHQIRAQLSAIGCPIIGDEKYGSTVDPAHRYIALHARSLAFYDPISEESKRIIAPMPKERWWLAFKNEKSAD